MKKFDLEQRLIDFAVLTLDITEILPECRGSNHLAGQLARAVAGQIEVTEAALARRDSVAARAVLKALRASRDDFLAAVDFIAGAAKSNPNAAYAGSVPYLMLAGNLVAGWQLARALLAAEDTLATDKPFMEAKIATARFYAEHILPRTASLRAAIVDGADSVTALSLEAF